MAEILVGRIIKGVAGMYTVKVPDFPPFLCPARGLFRKHGHTPIPGDMVEINSIDHEKSTAYLKKILPRANELIRPRAANVTQALVVTSLVSPAINSLVTDTMLAYLHSQNITPVLIINKIDIAPPPDVAGLSELYSRAGYKVFRVSAVNSLGLGGIADILADNVTILAGASGVGKSSVINALFPALLRETGELSVKIQRGKNTTRSCELFEITRNSYLADTPGFTSLDKTLLTNMPKEGVDLLFPEFEPFLGQCYYGDCLHVSEHDCAVKDEVGKIISRERYENYMKLLEK